MKQFKCENQQLAGFLEVLDKTIVNKGKVKRGKAKLFKALLKKQHEFEDDARCVSTLIILKWKGIEWFLMRKDGQSR